MLPGGLAMTCHTSVLAFLQERESASASVRQAMHAANQLSLSLILAGLLTFQVGDEVSLKAKHLQLNTLPRKKLFPK